MPAIQLEEDVRADVQPDVAGEQRPELARGAQPHVGGSRGQAGERPGPDATAHEVPRQLQAARRTPAPAGRVLAAVEASDEAVLRREGRRVAPVVAGND